MRTRLIEMLRRGFRGLPSSWQHVAQRARTSWQTAAGRSRFQRQLRSGGPLKIVVGSSGVCPPGWIASDIEYLNLLRGEHWAGHFAKASIDAILAEHVWEHLTPEEGLFAARTCHEYLKPGGYLRVAVPDGFHPDPTYREWVRVGGTGPGADNHKVLYNHETFDRLFRQAGFEVRWLEYFDAQGSFHGTPWDPALGMIHRSQRFDPRNAGDKMNYTSLVLDARKPITNPPT